MSEDIDLILDWRILGDEYNLESWQKDERLSKNKLNNNKKDILSKTNNFLVYEFVPDLIKGIKEDLGYEINATCEDENGGIVIYVHYPKTSTDEYLLDVVKLEIGPIAALTPVKEVSIKPYCFECFQQLFNTKEINVKTVIPERSFWEKATILHREALRPSNKPMPIRYFRHYYDLYMIEKSPYKDSAINDVTLLKEVVNFKEKFYRETWMSYDSILKDGIRLIPDTYRFEKLKDDYDKMKEMIQDDIQFDNIINCLKILEYEINAQLKKSIL